MRDEIAATKTDNVVAFFQKRATKKITNIPGVNNPVKFCMNWKIESKLPRRGWATHTAMRSDSTTVTLPIKINFAWDTSYLEKDL